MRPQFWLLYVTVPVERQLHRGFHAVYHGGALAVKQPHLGGSLHPWALRGR